MHLSYEGGELDLFSRARNWKAYWSREIRPYVAGRILEVGGGIGANLAFLLDDTVQSVWVIEPDPDLLARLRGAPGPELPEKARLIAGTLSTLEPGHLFDAVLYLDVLEHIEDHRGELERAGRILAPGGRLIVLAPAHSFLFSPFDRQIGHHRRYSRQSLAALQPPGLHLVLLRYLDSAGLLASLANKVLLRQALPTPAQIGVWDRFLVPVSRLLDPLLGYRVGKSVLAVWRKEN